MGGKGSGGHRPGSGSKKKTTAERWLHGSTQGTRAAARPAVDHLDVPDDLTTDERLVWLRLAPHALQAGTLAPATEYQFGLLCQNIVLERAMRRDVEKAGDASHRGIIQRIDAELARFCLAPMGKPIVEAAPEADPFAEFDRPDDYEPEADTLQ